ncbi:putative N6-adenine-specific DNA methylase [Dongia mobilis]|uniref:Putative N6-adenine-specific DNA methylase n=2 Tax=Dongia mobilis TaxID=578943 RepID=A0A4R6WP39_9PROT|nr:putative N6-adenine-specific DNA methylase [Dongia mobilis]
MRPAPPVPDQSVPDQFEIFLVANPGFEATLCAEARAKGFAMPAVVPGGVTIAGGWPEVWRANLQLRGVSRVLVRIAAFPVFHLAQLDKRARKVEWGKFLKKDEPFQVEASCRHSKIYHSGAAAERIRKAIEASLGAQPSADAAISIKARIEDDLCTISIDTSGESLHKRGHKEAVNKAPMRETLAALFLQQCGYDGTEPVLDPMCGSGTFVIEAAEIALGLDSGRTRSFAFEKLPSFDPVAWEKLKAATAPVATDLKFHGCDRDAGAIEMSRANAARAGVEGITTFRHCGVTAATAPRGKPGLVIVNPPYGARLGDKKRLYGLYRSLGDTLRARFAGWRVAVITSDATLARATNLPFGEPFGPVSHGGTRVHLFQTGPLPPTSAMA